MQLPNATRNQIIHALNKLDDCRALLEEVLDDIAIQDSPEQDTLDVLREEIQDWLGDIYSLDHAIAPYTIKEKELA